MTTRLKLDPVRWPDDLRVIESSHYKSKGIVYAYVLLDREDFMRSGRGRPLSERVREEIRRLGYASSIWLALHGADRTTCGDGDMRPHLCVPLSEEERLVNAFRDAELSDDVSSLRAIREQFEPVATEVETWFVPGSERTLTRGENFHCAPSRMLAILRKWAKNNQPRLKLNGRVDGQQIHIAPERPYQRRLEAALARAAKAKNDSK